MATLKPPINDATEAPTNRRRKTRQSTRALWCALGTEVYILLALQGTQGAAAVKSTLATAIQEVETQLEIQTVVEGKTGIAAGSAPVYSLDGSEAKLTVSNAAGVNITWLELELGLLMMADWMGENNYGWGSASVWDGESEVGIIYVTV